MKKNTLINTLQALQEPRPEQTVELSADVISRARKSLQNMFEMTK